MSNIDLLYFGEIELPFSKDYQTTIQLNDLEVLLDIYCPIDNQTATKITSGNLKKVDGFLRRLPRIQSDCIDILVEDYASKFKGVVYEYIEWHMENNEYPELEENIESINLEDPLDPVSTLHLKRIGFSPYNPDYFAVFDFSFFQKNTEHVIAIFFNTNGQKTMLTLEG